MKKRNGSREALREVLGIGSIGSANGSREDKPATVSIGPSPDGRSVLDELVRQGACRMLQAALEAEVEDFVERHDLLRDARACRQVIRNGYLPERTILTGAGPLRVRQPRVRDLAVHDGEKIEFRSAILPPYLRRSKTIDELIPWLYLRGISTGAMGEALEALVGPEAKGLSANVVARLKEKWAAELDAWRKRDLAAERFVYWWVDGIHFNIRLEDEENRRMCVLVVIAATADGKKVLLAVQDGYRESEASWTELLQELKGHGLAEPPRLVTGDGALGFWAAVRKVFENVREQRCWVHKTANVLDKLPKSVQPRAKEDLHDIWMAETREKAHKAFDKFVAKYEANYPKAVECLKKDRDELLTFYDFPSEHWSHLRTTNPIESTFATVRLRHDRTKGNGTRQACLTMVFKLIQSAAKHWRRLNGFEQIVPLIQGKKFVNGKLQGKKSAKRKLQEAA
jgi:transposase-like protein